MPITAIVIDKARTILGNQPDNTVGEVFIPDAAITTTLAPMIRDLNEVCGSATGLKEFVFSATPDVQDYAISSTLGADVYEIVEVIRSGAYVADTFLSQVDPLTGQVILGGSIINPGLQGDSLRVIIQQIRARHNDAYEFEVVNGATLRLMPVPRTPEVVAVRYIAIAFDMSSLPDKTETVLVHAACVAILNAIINRINQDRQTADTYGQAKTERLRTLVSQRDYYQGLYQREYDKLAR